MANAKSGKRERSGRNGKSVEAVRPPGSGFTLINQPRAHHYVYEQLRRHIGLGLVEPGNSLPPERELAKTFGVGRATIQRAIRMLEEDQIVEIRRGRKGGTYVLGLEDDGKGLKRQLAELRKSKAQIEEALVFRRIAEEASVQLAATTAGEADIAAMQKANENMQSASSDQSFHRYDTEFHLQIARAIHNALVYDTVERARLLLHGAIIVLPESNLWHARIEAQHQAIIDAIRAQDGNAAKQLMTEHLLRTEQSIRALLIAL